MNLSLYRFFLFIFLVSCASAKQPPKFDVLNYTSEQKKQYTEYLVGLDRYTSNGKKYHVKFEKYLYGVAKILIEEKKLNVSPGSIGFYYDKKQSLTSLYFGVDIKVPANVVWQNSSYIKNIQNFIKIHMAEVMSVLESCEDIIKEDDITGLLLGIGWERKGSKEFVNIWTSKKVVKLYFENKITFREFVVRSVLTDTDGEIITIGI